MPGKRISSKKWQQIENEYVEGDISQRNLAEKYRIAYETIRDRSISKNWKIKQDQFRSKIVAENERLRNEKAKEKAAYIEKKRDRESIIAQSFREGIVSKEFVKIKDEESGKIKKVLNPDSNIKDIKDAMLALKYAQEYEDRALGIDKLNIAATIEDKTNWRDKVERSAERTAEILTILDECRNRKTGSD